MTTTTETKQRKPRTVKKSPIVIESLHETTDYWVEIDDHEFSTTADAKAWLLEHGEPGTYRIVAVKDRVTLVERTARAFE